MTWAALPFYRVCLHALSVYTRATLRRGMPLLVVVTSACSVGPPAELPAAGDVEASLVIDGGTLIDTQHGRMLPDTRIVVREARITCVGTRRSCPAPQGATMIDARNRWIIPGLFDAHVHMTEEQGSFGPLYLAFGVTSVRDMGGYPDSSRALRNRIAAGLEPGPRIFFAGHPIDGDPPAWPSFYPDVPRVVQDTAEARTAVRRAVEEGADFIKLYQGLTSEPICAAVSQAHALGVRVALDHGVLHPDRVLPTGVDGMEHQVAPFSPRGTPSRYDWQRDAQAMERIFDGMREREVSLTSTLVLIDGLVAGDLPRNEPTFQALPPALQLRSEQMLSEAGASDTTRLAFRRQVYDYWCNQAREFVARGGLLLAGS